MTDYKFTSNDQSDGVIRLSDGAYIPKTVRNRDWMDYLEYVDGGGETAPWRTAEDELKDIRNDKYTEIRDAYANLANTPVTIPEGTFNGSDVPPARKFNAINLAIEEGETTIIFTDFDNKELTLTIQEAKQIARALGKRARTHFLHKQALMRATREANDVSEIEAIQVTFN